MKSLLIGFFQLLCFIHVFGSSQLNSYPLSEANNPFIHFHHNEHSHFVTKLHRSRSSFDSNSSLPDEDTELVFENLEEETEGLASQRHLEGNQYFLGLLYDQSLDYLYGDLKNNLTSCDRLPFIVSNRRHVVLQVFRI
ncbi:hypothetical protein [Fluviicola sp.]|jgi:hypothetical protein|uniref:hypothetical protein n=1 Tax=Fluviicola sp. TaxID=1917219 RepID=UPI00282ACAD6|nr:hypothetical protein [Fluviicola sp.]MDR0800988.1 hypothetical protein [Fluviicola sp.]